MSQSALPGSSPTPSTTKRNRNLLIAGLVGVILVCSCIVAVVAVGGLYATGRLALFGKGSPTPIALAAATSTPGASTTTIAGSAVSNLPTAPSIPNSPTAAATSAAPTTIAASDTPEATSPSSTNWPVLLSDSFVSNDNGWNLSSTQPDTSDYGTVRESIGGGKLHLEPNLTKAVNLKYWPKNLPQVSDFSVAVDGIRSSGSNGDYGIFFRMDSKYDTYVFLIREDKKQFAVLVYQGQWATVIDWSPSDAIQAGQVNHLGVTAVGSHFTFSINNQQVGSADNNQVASGVVGVTFDLQANNQAVFDFSNFQVLAPAGSAQANPTVPTTLSTPAPTGEWPIVLSDTFASNSNGWNISANQPGTDDYGTYAESISNGKLTIDAKAVKGTDQKRWPNIAPVSDMSLTTSARLVSGPTSASYGLVFRKSDAGFYIFEINDSKKFSVWVYQGQWTTLINWTDAPSLQPGQANQLNVTAVGGHFTFSINGQQVGSIDNAQLGTGVAGVMFDMDANIEAVFEFSNFELRAPAAAAHATPGSVAQWPVVLTDGFTSNANGWNIAANQPATDDYGTYAEAIGGGKFTIDAQVTKGTDQKRWPNMSLISDMSVTTSARLVSGPTSAVYGIVFRKSDSGFYIFEINDSKQFGVWLHTNQWTTLIDWTSAASIQPGQTNQLSVTAVGNHFTFSINGQQVGAIDNAQLTSGVAGLVFDMDANTKAVFEFSNFEVRAPSGVPQATLTPSGAGQASPTPAGSGGVIFADNFTSNANGWNLGANQPYTDNWGTYTESIGGGKFTIDAQVVKGVDKSYWPKSLQAFTDASVSVDARRVSGPTTVGYGLKMRADGNGNFYVFEINDTGQFSILLFKGQWTTLVKWTSSNSVQPGQVNHLDVSAVGSHFTFSVNGQQVSSIDDTQVSSGVAGVVFDMDPGQAVFEYSNFQVKVP